MNELFNGFHFKVGFAGVRIVRVGVFFSSGCTGVRVHGVGGASGGGDGGRRFGDANFDGGEAFHALLAEFLELVLVFEGEGFEDLLSFECGDGFFDFAQKTEGPLASGALLEAFAQHGFRNTQTLRGFLLGEREKVRNIREVRLGHSVA